MVDLRDGFAADLRAIVGDDLRAVATYERGAHRLLHVRDDLTDQYTTVDMIEGLDQVEIEGMGYTHFSKLFDTGEFTCAIYRFEEAQMYHFPVDEFSGLFVTHDRTTDHDEDAVIEACLEGLRAAS